MLSPMSWNNVWNRNKADFKLMETPLYYLMIMTITLPYVFYTCNACCNTCAMARDHSHSTRQCESKCDISWNPFVLRSKPAGPWEV